MHSQHAEEAGVHTKKKSLRANEQRRPDIVLQRRAWGEKRTGVDVRRLVFLDETGAKTNMTRAFARARKGQRATDYAPQGHCNTTTLVAAITVESSRAPMVLEGPMDALAFEAYVEHVLIPDLPAHAIVVTDNLSRG